MNIIQMFNPEILAGLQVKKYYRLLGGIIVFIIGIVILNNLRIKSDTQFLLNSQEMKKAQKYISSYRQEEVKYQDLIQNLASPIEKSEMDQVQNFLVQKIKRYSLDIQGIQTMVNSAMNGTQITGEEFEVTVNGSWYNSMQYLNDLKSEPVLINLRSVRMEAISGTQGIQTIFKYKIYTD